MGPCKSRKQSTYPRKPVRLCIAILSNASGTLCCPDAAGRNFVDAYITPAVFCDQLTNCRKDTWVSCKTGEVELGMLLMVQ
ncbi:hypothetical protein BCR43DRAFT_312497 [Syncephalastrum racemosum]|uniref:Uncharacterized protein n=1 Tax=Syncephalastrum racemosum TaxID=13706 RepID=A0A1X2HAS6_SYNRA|nr:hypothetical protein BCR43DRAFT_312497 [Syncephalastrum racemosum]